MQREVYLPANVRSLMSDDSFKDAPDGVEVVVVVVVVLYG